MTQTLVTIAAKSNLIMPSLFNNYDLCINTYVGCEFGCTYCYVRFTVKDKEKEWGEFVRVRDHVKDKLAKELNKGYVLVPSGVRTPILDEDGQPTGKTKVVKTPLQLSESRLVIGTMTDPYQPAEKKFRITRHALSILLEHSNRPKKIGIFTRSPLVLQDLDLITKLPQGRVHFTITPYPTEVMRAIEPISPLTASRWSVIKRLKDAGIRVHVNVAPIMPVISESLIDEWAKRLAELKVDEYFVDPMQCYANSWQAFKDALNDKPYWPQIESIMQDKQKYLDWKFDYLEKWNASRIKYQHLAPDQLPIWSDHENHVWIDMRTGEQMDKRCYNNNA